MDLIASAASHGGYTQIIETETHLTGLYVLPINGKQIMHFKRYHADDLLTDDLLQKVVTTEESLAEEEELVNLLIKDTNLTEEEVKKTIHLVKQAHGTAKRKSGVPYYTHPMAVAKILLQITKDPDTILAALLHDLIEDTHITLHHIKFHYGSTVAYIVDMVTHYNTKGYRWQVENVDHQTVLDQCKDIRVNQVKLADRLHNLQTISIRKPEDQIRIAKETLEFYIPWAKKHNLMVWAEEMKVICTRILDTYDH